MHKILFNKYLNNKWICQTLVHSLATGHWKQILKKCVYGHFSYKSDRVIISGFIKI